MAARKKVTRKTTTRSANQDYLKQVESFLEGFFTKAPSLPKGLKEFIVKFGPWLMIVGLIFALPAMIAALGLTAFFAPIAYLGKSRMSTFGVDVVISTVALALNAVALPGLFKRAMSGWRLLFYSSLLMAFGNLITFDLSSLVVGSLVGWYILFQVKSYYK